MLQCNANEAAAVRFYKAKGFIRELSNGTDGNNNCWDYLPEALQEGLKQDGGYMFIEADSFPMDLMILEPTEKLVLQRPHAEEDKDFALRYPSSTLTCDQLEDILYQKFENDKYHTPILDKFLRREPY